ncbi:chemotaxis protein CheX [Paenibacillus macquariensis]|uniref:Chemotaxis protein CheX n=2 Tax=Paenibacillus macquariensis TaxID=948756 RepID=A0ABY1JT66_9BACL|nr:chemotaxis protein CheX [Paenibacillus macquariensis]
MQYQQTSVKGHFDMKAEIINPFLESARIVIEQVICISPSTGDLGIKNIEIAKGDIWIQVGMTGQLTGNVVFGLKETVALKIVSAMMGGFVITEMDEMGKSAISELSNMISGNASTILYNQGVNVDITPPKIVSPQEHPLFFSKKALSIPLMMAGIGELDIQVMIS